MARKISFLILSAAILITGVIAFKKLNYWERSVRIFAYSSDAPFDGRIGRGQRGFEGRGGSGERDGFDRQEGSGERFARPVMRQLPDSIRTRFETGEGRPGRTERNIPDSLRQQFRQGEKDRTEVPAFEGRMRNSEGHGRGEFPDGKKINLRSVYWFLAVFASLTVMAIYSDKAICMISRRKVRQGAIKEKL